MRPSAIPLRAHGVDVKGTPDPGHPTAPLKCTSSPAARQSCLFRESTGKCRFIGTSAAFHELPSPVCHPNAGLAQQAVPSRSFHIGKQQQNSPLRSPRCARRPVKGFPAIHARSKDYHSAHYRLSVRCFSANSTIFFSTNIPFLFLTPSTYPLATLALSAFSPRSSSSSTVVGTQNGSWSSVSKPEKMSCGEAAPDVRFRISDGQ